MRARVPATAQVPSFGATVLMGPTHPEPSFRPFVTLVGSAKANAARAQVLTHGDMAAANTFQNPSEVKLSQLPVSVAGNGLSAVIPKQAVVAIEIDLV